MDGPETFVEVLPLQLALVPASATSPCGGSPPWQVVHRIRVGSRPEALILNVEDTLQAGLDAWLWVEAAGCGGASLGCSGNLGLARTPRLVTPVMPAGTELRVVVAFSGEMPPTLYGLRVLRLPQTVVAADVPTGCEPAPIVVAPGLVVMQRAGSLDASLPWGPTCGGEPDAQGAFRVLGPAVPHVVDVENAPAGATRWAAFDAASCSAAQVELACGEDALALSRPAAATTRLQWAGAATNTFRLTVRRLGAEGDPCSGDGVRCAPPLLCLGPAAGQWCQDPPPALFELDASQVPLDAVVVDADADGQTFASCSAPGCTLANQTGHDGPFYAVADASVPAGLEALEFAPVHVDGASVLQLWVRQAHTGAGSARLLVNPDGNGFVTAAWFLPGESGDLLLDLTGAVSGASDVSVRLEYERAAPGASTGSWQVAQLVLWSL